MTTLLIHGVAGGPRLSRARTRWLRPVFVALLLGVGAGRGGRLFQEMWKGLHQTRELNAINTLKEIAAAEAVFRAGAGAGFYGSLAAIVSCGLVGSDLADGERLGYAFHVAPSVTTADFLWAATAEPVEQGRCERSFIVNQAGVIFYTEDGPISVMATCTLPVGPPWFWVNQESGGKSSPPGRVPTIPVRGGLWGDR